MIFGIATEINDRPMLITSSQSGILPNGYNPDVLRGADVIFTDKLKYKSGPEVYLNEHIFGAKPSTIKEYQEMAKRLESDLLKPLYKITGHKHPLNAVLESLPREYMKTPAVPSIMRDKVLDKVLVAETYPHDVEEIDIKRTDWENYTLPKAIGQMKLTKGKWQGPGLYRCAILANDNPQNKLLGRQPSSEIWLTHHQLNIVQQSTDIVVHDRFRFTDSGSKEIRLDRHPYIKPLVQGVVDAPLAKEFLRYVLFNLNEPGNNCTPGIMTILLRTQQWADAYQTAITYTKSGLSLVEYNHDRVVTEK